MAKSVEIPTTAAPPPPPPMLDNLFPLYAGNLHPDVTEGDLYTLFSKIGPVHSVRLCRDRSTGKSLRYGYVNFYLPSNAVAALRDLNHSELRGKPIRVMWVEKDPIIRNNGIGNLFVKNLDFKVNEGKLEEIFGVFGWIQSCNIAKDDDGNSKGFGFVQFYSEESASNALSALNGSVFEGKIMTVAKYLKKVERNEAQFTHVYVKSLDESFTESSLKEKFSEYGKVTSIVIMNDEQGKSRGFGFVNFQSHGNAAKGIEALNGAQIGSVYHGMSMNVSLAPSKEEIAKFLKTKCTPLTDMASDLQKSVENPAKKEEPANGACSCDDNEDDGFVLVM